MKTKIAVKLKKNWGLAQAWRFVPPQRLSYLGFECALAEVLPTGSVRFADSKGRWWARAEYNGALFEAALKAQGFTLTNEEHVERDTKNTLDELVQDLDEDLEFEF